MESSDRAVVFVHGLCGDAENTFGSWPLLVGQDQEQDTLGNTTGDLDVYSVNYDRLFEDEIDVRKVARIVTNLIESSHLVRDYNHLWFVTHSLGGLIVKQMVLDHHNAGKVRLIDRYAGIYYIAVPHEGSGLAEATSALPQWVVEALLCENYKLVTDLTSSDGNAYLDELGRQWANFRNKRRQTRRTVPMIYCAYETLNYDPTGTGWARLPGVRVVRKAAAATNCDEDPEPFPRDHREIAKPNGHDDLVYRWFRRLYFASIIALEKDRAIKEDIGQKPLAEIIDYWATERTDAQRWGPSGLPPLDARIEINPGSHERASLLHLLPMEYTGPEAARMFERIAQHNSCVDVDIADRRRLIRVTVTDTVRECVGPKPLLVCADQTCP